MATLQKQDELAPMPSKMRDISDLRELNKRLDQLQYKRKLAIDDGMKQKQTNAEVIADLKAQQEKLKESISERADKEARASDTRAEKNLTKDLALWRRKLDEMKNKTLKKREQLSALQDKQKEIAALSMDLSSDDNPQMKQIRGLENRLDKTMIKYNEALSIKKTYEIIFKKLSEERQGFEQQLSAIETSLKNKSYDLEELIGLSQDARLAQENAEKKLKRLEQTSDQDPNALNDPTSLSVDIQFDLGKSKKQPTLQKSSEMDPAIKKKFEAAMSKIDEATGVGSIEEIIDKAKKFLETNSSLQDKHKSYQNKLLALYQKRDNLREQLETLIVNGGMASAAASTQDVFDNQERHYHEVERQLKDLREEHEKVSRLRLELSSVICIMCNRLGITPPSDGKPAEKPAGDTLAEKLQECEEKLKTILVEAKSSNSAAASQQSSLGNVVSSDFNIRVKVPERQNTGNIRAGSKMDADSSSSDDDEMFRRRNRRASFQKK